MLGGQHDLGHFDRLATDIAQGHLALGIWTKLRLFPGMAGFCQQFQDLVAIGDRRWHQHRGFVAGIAEHDALIARAFVLIARGIDALGDMRRLRVQQHFDFAVGVMEAVLLVTDFLDGLAGNRFDHLVGDFLWATGFAGNHDAVGRGQRFRRTAQVPRRETVLGAFPEEQIDNFVRNPVAHLIGVTFRDAFAGKQIV